MSYIKQKLQNYRGRLTDKGLYEPRLLGLVLLAVIGLSVLWSGVGIVQQNYALLKKIAILEEENEVLELENSNKKIQNEYYRTPEFAELEARRVNGRAASGERVYIVTEEAALNSLKTPEVVQQQRAVAEKPMYQKNFEAWMDFFFGN